LYEIEIIKMLDFMRFPRGRPHNNPGSRRIEVLLGEAGVPERHSRRGKGKLCRAPHRTVAFVEEADGPFLILNFSAAMDAVPASVKRRNFGKTAPALNEMRPERINA
jgi:hypothetical protein